MVDEVQYLLNAVLIVGRSEFLWKRELTVFSMRWLTYRTVRFQLVSIGGEGTDVPDTLLQHFSAQTKIGPSERLRN